MSIQDENAALIVGEKIGVSQYFYLESRKSVKTLLCY